jgi:hypothetical protein
VRVRAPYLACWARRSVLVLCAQAALEVTALQFAPDGLTMSVGTSGGQCLLFDLRSSKPMLVKRHNNALPIVSLTFAEGTRQLVSADPKLVKIWDRDSGDVLTNIEPPADINHVCLWPGSGLLLMAAGQTECPRVLRQTACWLAACMSTAVFACLAPIPPIPTTLHTEHAMRIDRDTKDPDLLCACDGCRAAVVVSGGFWLCARLL